MQHLRSTHFLVRPEGDRGWLGGWQRLRTHSKSEHRAWAANPRLELTYETRGRRVKSAAQEGKEGGIGSSPMEGSSSCGQQRGYRISPRRRPHRCHRLVDGL